MDRELGEYLLESALSQFQSDRLLQDKVETADGQQVLEWALQHELSRGMHLVLHSSVLFNTREFRDLKLAVEVRNTMFEALAAGNSSLPADSQMHIGASTLESASIADWPANIQSSMRAGTVDSSSSAGMLDVFGSTYAGATEADRQRRLVLYVGYGPYSTGYELSSAASAADLQDHVKRSVKYGDQHHCLVFAVNLQRPKRPRGRPRKDPSPPFVAMTPEELKDAMEGFASWPRERPDKVCIVSVCDLLKQCENCQPCTPPFGVCWRCRCLTNWTYQMAMSAWLS